MPDIGDLAILASGVVSRGEFREFLVAGQGGGHGQASALSVVADQVRDLETTSSPWQAHAA